MNAVWGDDVGVSWSNAPEHIKREFALTRLYWFYRMVAMGGPDGSELDQAVSDEATEAAEWYGLILERMANEATR